MKRYLMSRLHEWKVAKNRKPLLLTGARQVGKTWLVREFASKSYDDLIELNFLTDQTLKQVFSDDISPSNIILQLEAIFNKKIDPEKTLLFFDEIQESQRAMDSLKSFNEGVPKYNIIAAGSFLGVMLGRRPVGQTAHLTLNPMSFYEFLETLGYRKMISILESHNPELINGLSAKFIELLKQYFFVGGMPEAVLEYSISKDLIKVREIHKRLIEDFKGDFSKHIVAKDIPKVFLLWTSIPVHLSKEKKKFVYKEIKSGGRASEFENALQWLVETRLVHKIIRVDEPKIPLSIYQSPNMFKLFLIDIGLLCAMTNVSAQDILLPNMEIMDKFNGAIAEQFVCQELVSANVSPIFYWGREKREAEIDFIIQAEGSVIPIEVKSGTRTKAKSLQSYMKDYNPTRAVVTSLKNFDISNNIWSIPLFMIAELGKI